MTSAATTGPERAVQLLAATAGLPVEWQQLIATVGGRDACRTLAASPELDQDVCETLVSHRDVEVRRRSLTRSRDDRLLAATARKSGPLSEAALANPATPERTLVRGARLGSWRALNNQATPEQERLRLLDISEIRRQTFTSTRRSASLRRARCWTLLVNNPGLAHAAGREGQPRSNWQDIRQSWLDAHERGLDAVEADQLLAGAGSDDGEVRQIICAARWADQPASAAWVRGKILRLGDRAPVVPLLVGRVSAHHGARIPPYPFHEDAAAAEPRHFTTGIHLSMPQWQSLSRFCQRNPAEPDLLSRISALSASWQAGLGQLLEAVEALG